MRPSHRESYERLCHDADVPRFLLDLGRDQALRRRLLEPRLERFIGVICRPDTELMSHYANASLPQQVDAVVWFDETSAVTPVNEPTICVVHRPSSMPSMPGPSYFEWR